MKERVRRECAERPFLYAIAKTIEIVENSYLILVYYNINCL
jgi:hypothetical protein